MSQVITPLNAGYSPAVSLWWQWTAPSSDRFAFSTSGSDFDTVLAVYTGATLATLTETASADDSNYTDFTSQVAFDAVIGQTYYIAVDGVGGDTGSIFLGWEPCPAPVNDDFTNAASISGTEGQATGSILCALGESNEVIPTDPGTPDVLPLTSAWWQWTAPADGSITFTTKGSGCDDTVLGVYEVQFGDNPDFHDLVEVTSNDDAPGAGGHWSAVTFAVTNGTTYFIAVDGWGGVVGDILLSWRECPPGNDDFASATVLPGTTGHTAGWNDCATDELAGRVEEWRGTQKPVSIPRH
ncbi:hypothetical protein ACFL0Q_08190, partial [Thermodesulfobacteriota bacterium]